LKTPHKKQKVKLISSVHFALDTRIFYKYAKTLSKEYDVTIIALHPHKETINGIQIIPFKEYKNRTLRILTSWFRMLLAATSKENTIYHFHDPELIPCGIIWRLMGKKVIMDIHENIADDIFDKEWLKFKKLIYFIFDKLERLACLLMPIVVAEKSYLKRYAKLRKDVVTIYNFVEPDFFKKFRIEKRDPLNLFYIGIVLESRCLIEIIEAMQILHNKDIKVHFHCVGKVYSRVKDLIDQHPSKEKLNGYLHFYGRMNLEDGYEISKQCGIGLCLIKPMSNSIESYPTKVFEYMACGIPIISSNFPLYKSIVEEKQVGKTADPLNCQSISEAIEKLIKAEEKRNLFSKNGIEVCEKEFNWEEEKNKLSALYQAIVTS